MVKIKIVQEDKDLPLPSYHTPQSAGCDLFAAESCILNPGEIKIVSTGLRLALPPGYEAHIRPRSGLAAKHGISLVNTPGTIDADYRGILKLIMINHGKESFPVNKGERVAQMIINKFEVAEWEQVDSLEDTERGDKGLGHTGL